MMPWERQYWRNILPGLRVGEYHKSLTAVAYSIRATRNEERGRRMSSIERDATIAAYRQRFHKLTSKHPDWT